MASGGPADKCGEPARAAAEARGVTPGEIGSAYRRMLASDADEELVCWWYSGWSFAQPAGFPEIPLSQITAIMSYRSRSLSEGRFRIDWSEVGVFRDPASGELPGRWTNPLTGVEAEMPRSFREGPGSYLVAPASKSVTLELEQPFAEVLELRVDVQALDGRWCFLQTERKRRGFPRPDGSLPPPGSSSGFESLTELGFYASRLALDAPDFVAAQGTYMFRLGGLPPWLGFGTMQGTVTTRGCITKARPGEWIDREAARRIATMFPQEYAALERGGR